MPVQCRLRNSVSPENRGSPAQADRVWSLTPHPTRQTLPPACLPSGNAKLGLEAGLPVPENSSLRAFVTARGTRQSLERDASYLILRNSTVSVAQNSCRLLRAPDPVRSPFPLPPSIASVRLIRGRCARAALHPVPSRTYRLRDRKVRKREM